jgi:hypothetical protein
MDLELLSIRPEMVTPGALVDHWCILESLGTRGLGALYRVEDVRHPGEPRVLKLSLRAGAPELTGRREYSSGSRDRWSLGP